MKNKSKLINVLLIVVILILASIIAASVFTNNHKSLDLDLDAQPWQGSRPVTLSGFNSPGIAIPGFDAMTFVANQTNQDVNLYNPDTNFCLFKMSLLVDEEVLWESELVEPGKGFYEITLTRPLAPDTTTGYLYIQCFTYDGIPLNSAKVKFDLYIIKEE